MTLEEEPTHFYHLVFTVQQHHYSPVHTIWSCILQVEFILKGLTGSTAYSKLNNYTKSQSSWPLKTMSIHACIKTSISIKHSLQNQFYAVQFIWATVTPLPTYIKQRHVTSNITPNNIQLTLHKEVRSSLLYKMLQAAGGAIKMTAQYLCHSVCSSEPLFPSFKTWLWGTWLQFYCCKSQPQRIWHEGHTHQTVAGTLPQPTLYPQAGLS